MYLPSYLSATLRQRRYFDKSDVKREAVIFCTADEVSDAIAWYMGVAGRPPFAIATVKDVKCDVGSSLLMKTKRINTSPHLLCIVFGISARRKCVELARYGLSDLVLDRDPKFRNSKFYPSYFADYSGKLQSVFEMLEDEESRLSYASVIKHRVTGDHGYLRIAKYREYCHPLVCAEPGDTVIDGGASNGHTSFSFGRSVGPKGQVFAIEPDPTNADAIIKSIKTLGVTNVELAQLALSDENGFMRFSATSDGSSRLEVEGNITVPTKRIDDLNLDRCDLISLDVEGAEAAAIRGAQRVILKHRPKLQISIYHRHEDLFELPLMIRETVPDYAFFIGHHDAYHSETDLYAIPRERLQP